MKKRHLEAADLPEKELASSTDLPEKEHASTDLPEKVSGVVELGEKYDEFCRDEEEETILRSMPLSSAEAVEKWFTIPPAGPDRTQEQCDEDWLQILRGMGLREVFQLDHYIYKFAIPRHDFNQDAEAACSSADRLNKLHGQFLKEINWFEDSHNDEKHCAGRSNGPY